MSESSAGSHGRWDSTPSRNLLLPENLDLVRQEFLNNGVIFGWHYYYAGGRSGDMFCFGNFESYYQALRDSRPGDHFTVYSRNRLASSAMFRVGDPKSNKPIVNADEFSDVKNALAAGEEVVFVWCHERPEIGGIECDAGILWDLAEKELEESLGLGPGRMGEIVFFLIPLLDEDEDGNPITSVSPGSKRRVNAVVDGKRPNEAGLTPASGPY